MIPIKRPAEIEGMRRAGACVAEVLEKTAAIIAPGLTTREVDAFAAAEIARLGAKSAFLGYRGFPGNICISVNEEVVHGIGGSRRLQVGDVVKLDVGLIKEGWIGDTATTVPVGIVEPAVAKLLDVTRASLYEGIAQAKDGNRVGDISHAVEQYVIRHGFTVVREFVGHGVGRKLHEEPQVPNYGRPRNGPKLKAGMTLAIEPMVNMGRCDVRILADGWTVVATDGLKSSHFEHVVLVTEGEPEILTCRAATASK
ncbi:methionyl aminopeptidase [Verrucomicrobium sp. GAS474]|uniref:type I methionyl aminopeptidase n=1 Tax=Verrucomicrobium sp. GAS474 TaxID=1882831 RepID=UPI00087CEB7C|nr:type I methionyl aminopeptidase [Verrucomicrobium sp. GAS474]SDU25825.1 methionyl aminopeptidase [Verrucomicrobium sp. GAS474]